MNQAPPNSAPDPDAVPDAVPDAAGLDAVLAGIRQHVALAARDRWTPEAEARFLATLADAGEDALPVEALQRVFRELLSATRALHAPLVVAYLGPEGTYTHAAVDAHFGHAVTSVPEPSIPEVFRAVESGRAAFGVVPVENSTEGSVNHTLDVLGETPLRVCGEVNVRIQHCLMSDVTSLADIDRVLAHPQSLAQCRQWLDAHLPQAERISQSSNAAAAEFVAAKHPGTGRAAAIASASAAERYGLQVLQANIEDVKTNTTRFLVMGDRDLAPSGRDATSLLVSAPHRPGGLRQLLEPFETAGVSLTRIESRPNRTGLWEYVFFIDVAGHQQDPVLGGVLARLRDELPLLRVLGSYPSAH